MINGKSYIGFDSKWPKRRRDHLREALKPSSPSYNFVFHKALRKYGQESFSWTVVWQCDDRDLTLSEFEPLAIMEFDTHYRFGHGYNMGQGAFLST